MRTKLGMPSLAVLIILAIGFRLPALFLLRYGGPVPDWSDFRYYHELAALSAQGYFPDIQFWVEYPPLFPWLAVGAYQLSLLIPSWIQPYFWFDLILTIVLAAADAGTVLLIDRLGDAFWGEPAGRRSATIYAAFFLPTFAILGWFDSLPTFFLLLALAVIVSVRGRNPGLAQEESGQRPDSSWAKPGYSPGRAVFAGFAAGVGIMLKLFPVLALPAATIVARGSSEEDGGIGAEVRARFPLLRVVIVGIATVATVILVSVPFLLRSPATYLAGFRNVLARGAWMSPWAILDGYYQTGGVASLPDRLFYNASALWGQPDRYPAIWWAAVALGLIVYLWRWWAARRVGTPRAAIAFTGFGVCLALLLSRGFSQQFTVWLLPFVALVLPGVAGAILVVLLTLNDIVLEGYLYVTLFPSLHQLLWISATVRTLLLLWFAVEAAVAIDPKGYVRFAMVRRRLVAPAAGVLIVGAVGALIAVAPNVQAAMLTRNGAGPAVAAIQKTAPTTALVFTQPDIFDELAADLRPRPSLLVAEPKLLTWTGDRSLYHRLDVGLQGRATVLLVVDSTKPESPLLPAIRSWLDAHYGAAPPSKAGALTLEEFSKSRVPAEHAVGVTFGEAMTLVGVRPAQLTAKPGAPLVVTLDWRASKKIARDYTVSLQLLDPHGKLVAQHDAMPANNTLPTTGWTPGENVADAITLPLPKGLAAGKYPLIVVVYDHQTLERLTAHGTGQSGDHAAIGTVTVSGS